MSCKTAFFALELDLGAQECLHQVAKYVQHDTMAAMDVNADARTRTGTVASSTDSSCGNIGFTAAPLDRLHMTLVFCGEGLLKLSAGELSQVHAELDRVVQRYAPEVDTKLEFAGFDLFPPTKNNLLVAKFAAPPTLHALRRDLWEVLLAAGGKEGACAVVDDSEWMPHVTLGKFRASSTQIGLLKCSGLNERFLRSTVSDGEDCVDVMSDGVPANGIALRGERPKRIWLDWDWEFQ